MKGKKKRAELPSAQRQALFEVLQRRFESNMHRHEGIEWAKVQKRLEADAAKLRSVHEMETTGGEPDVVWRGAKASTFVFVDCAAQSPKGRRSVCYDDEALASRKEHKPKASAYGMAAEMGVEILTEEQYRRLQTLGELDTTTSSWVATPSDIRARGGALFCDRRYGHVFLYHNGAESYYAARGFRAALEV